MNLQDMTPEEVKHIKTVQDYTELVTSKDNHLGLCGYQPTLTKIRAAYQDGQISDTDLSLVLNNVAVTLKGEPEAFESKDHAWRYMFGKSIAKSKPQLNPTTLSVIEQCAAIKDIMPAKKKYSGPRKKAAPKKKDAINVSALPAHLQHLAK